MPEPLNKILDKLACVSCPLGYLCRVNPETLQCSACKTVYPIVNGIPCFVPDDLIHFSEVPAEEREKFLQMKEFAYSGNSLTGKLYNNYHTYAAAWRRRLSLDADILDIGCGIGEHYPFISDSEKSGSRFIALDIDRFKLDHFHTNHPEIALLQGSACRLPFRAASFDILQLLATLEHFTVDEVAAVLREALRVLKPGGYLIACYPAEGSLLLRGGQFVMHSLIRLKTGFDLEREEVHHHHVTAQTIQTMLLATPGLSLRESIHYPLDVKTIHLSLFLNELYQKECS